MMLLLDIGNTRIKWALSDGSSLGAGGVLAHAGDPAACLAQWVADVDVAEIWVAQVMGAAQQMPVAEVLRRRYGHAPQFVQTAAEWRGLRNAYAEPLRLGVDRWLAMVAIWAAGPADCCVADAGTALTVDCIAADGQHLGGIIAAGLSVQQRATLGNTRFEARTFAPAYDTDLGRDTERCVQQGSYLACLGAIDRCAGMLASDARRWIGGGDGAVLHAGLEAGWSLRPQLVLEGLLAIALDV